MPKFRKRPVVVEARQWHKPGDHPAVKNGAGTLPWPEGTITIQDGVACGFIETLEGNHIVRPGDWIVTGTAGEHYPCKPEIFAEIYEPVEG